MSWTVDTKFISEGEKKLLILDLRWSVAFDHTFSVRVLLSLC